MDNAVRVDVDDAIDDLVDDLECEHPVHFFALSDVMRQAVLA